MLSVIVRKISKFDCTEKHVFVLQPTRWSSVCVHTCMHDTHPGAFTHEEMH